MHYVSQIHLAVLEAVEPENRLHGGWTASVVCRLPHIRQINQGDDLSFSCKGESVVAVGESCILEVRIDILHRHHRNPPHLSS